MQRYRQHLIALVAAGALVACGDNTGNGGGAGGSAGTGGAGGAGATGGSAGSGGAAGAGGTGGTTNTAPEATIIQPGSDSGTDNPDYAYDGFDDDLGLWYKDVTLEGSGTDAEDGTLTGTALEWKTNQTTIQDEILSTGTNPTVRLYSDDCFGTEHTIVLEVTDSDGQTTASEPRVLFIWTLC